MVYFITDGTHTKIGYTENQETLNSRIYSLQTGNANELKVIDLLEDEGYATETLLHHYFSDIRMVGEWFRGIITTKDFDLDKIKKEPLVQKIINNEIIDASNLFRLN